MENKRKSTQIVFIAVCVHACMGAHVRVCDCGILMPLVFLPTSAGASRAWTTRSFSAAWYNNLAFTGNEDQLWRKQLGDSTFYWGKW